MFEKEKKQYEEDCKNHERPWELWQAALTNNGILDWIDLYREPNWSEYCVYRRKQIEFVPEYFSGLNWRDAAHLIGKTVEYSNCPDRGWKFGFLKMIAPTGENFAIDIYGHPNFYIYIRTCEGTYQPTTINIGGVDLPKPETVAPALGIKCWLAPACNEFVWGGYNYNIENLQAGRVHLTEERAKAWADWWKATVIDKMK